MIDNWDELLGIFGTDDGSLPDIELNNLVKGDVILGYEFIRDHASYISSKEPSYWSTLENCDVQFSYSDNIATLVVSGTADPIHLCFDGITSPSGKRIPELGLYIFTDGLSLDYRMGPEWNQGAIQGLFELISSLPINHNNLEMAHKSNLNDYDGSIFKSCFQAYKNSVRN
jgi:hypothetical protein